MGNKRKRGNRGASVLHAKIEGTVNDRKRDARATKPEGDSPVNFRLKIVGIGGAGCNVINHIAEARSKGATALGGVDLVAVNTNLQSLQGTTDAERIQIGSTVTRGLGAGGDTEIGARAAQQDAERLTATMQNVDLVFIVTGLGGGTGGGAGPVVARLAREQGAFVVAFTAMPFAFEGERRRQQALASLDQLKAQADAAICIPNDKLSKLVGDSSSVVDAFRRGNEIMASGAQAIWQLLSRKGLINLDFADLRTTLGAKHGEGVFSYGEGSGPDKARDAVKALLESPVFDGNDTLAKTEGVLVSILGGPDLTLADVQKAVEPISRHAVRAKLIMGAAIDETYRDRLAVTVIAATSAAPVRSSPLTKTKPLPASRPGDIPQFRRTTLPSSVAPGQGERVLAATPAESSQTKEPAKPKQETLPLESVSRGRFDKTEPTIYDGEDLDVPTFLRRGVSLKR